MKLRSQLKAKQSVQESHDQLQKEVAEYKSKYLEQQKKQGRALDHIRELKSLLEEQVKVNSELKKKLRKYEKNEKKR